ncbi:MAG: RsmD family RNA methyltransferase, partial [Alistipes sp.]|nr:RsmD family RNA methyltransferase [Alistipes sp.]
MTRDELEILLLPEVRKAIEENIERDPLRVALDRHVPHARVVASQVKYLQRAKSKLPRLYAARAILPDRAFEQSSSDECAAAKRIGGGTLLDLTCGLGVDSMHFAERFERVVALERDEVLADVVRENMRRMGVENVEVVTASAEEYVAHAVERGERFDWVYADPDRRTADGRRVVRLEECSPNVVALMPLIGRLTERVALKNSPLFDVDEAFRLFAGCGVEVISLGDECKEVMIYIDGREPMLAADAISRGRIEVNLSDLERFAAEQRELTTEDFASGEYRYLVVPDVALQKALLVNFALGGKAVVCSNNSFGFARTMPDEVVGR